jgi:hypothetical protein
MLEITVEIAWEPREGSAPDRGANVSDEILAYLPDAEYDMIFSMKPNELLDSEFVENLKTEYPMSQLFLMQVDAVAEKSGLELGKINSVLMAMSGSNPLLFGAGTFDQEEARQAFEDNQGLILEKVDIAGKKVWLDADNDKGLLFIGNVSAIANKNGLEKVIACTADPEKSFVNGENYARLGKYFDAEATMSFISSKVEGFDPGKMVQGIADDDDDEETISNLTTAAEKIEGFAGSFRISDAINGKVFVLFAEADAATTFADYFNGKKMTAFKQAADVASQATGQINADREKILALANKINFGTEGNALRISIDIAWSDIAFLFEGGDQ